MQQANLRPLTESVVREMTEISTGYEEAVWQAEDYLAKRGIDQETAATFRLGFVDTPAPGHEQYQGYLSIPYMDGNGDVLTIRFRCIGDHSCKEKGHGKYLTIHGDQARMFNIPAIVHNDTLDIHIAEGEIDGITLNMCGLPAVGMPGATSWQNHHSRMLAGFENVYVWADPDNAGKDMAKRISEAIPRSKVIPLQTDVNDTFTTGGMAAILDIFEGSRWRSA